MHRIRSILGAFILLCAATAATARDAAATSCTAVLDRVTQESASDAGRAPRSGIPRGAWQTAAEGERSARGTSNRCYTPAADCILDTPQRVGSSCWCPTPFGPSFGRVR